MIDIQWKGKVGYGDIVSPICYAHNVSYFTGQRVVLSFRWDTGPEFKFKPSDPETLWERASYIHSVCSKTGTSVDLIHLFNNPMKENHTNYDWDVVGRDRFHNFWNPKPDVVNDPKREYVIVNSTVGNQITLKQYGKSWKDPLAERWVELQTRLQDRGIQVITVDYSTPIRQLIRLLGNAQAFIGYHGTAAWVARFTQTPSIIIGGTKGLTLNAFPNAHVLFNTEVKPFVDTIDTHMNAARVKQRACMDAFEKYNIPRETIRHLTIS